MKEEVAKLKKLYEESIKDKSTVTILNDYLWSSKALIDYYMDVSLSVLKEDTGLVEGLDILIRCLRYVYTFSGLDICISDPDYDILVDKLEQLKDMEIDFDDDIGPVKEKGYHLYPSLRGTLDKVYFLTNEQKVENSSNRRSLPDWISTSKRKIEEKTGKSIDLEDEEIYVFPKWDGVSVVFEFDKKGSLIRALTRGYTKLNEAMIVTSVFADLDLTHVKSVVKKGLPFGVKTEVMTSEEGLREYNKEHPEKKYKNSRSFASALINQEVKLDRVLLKRYLQIIPLRVSYYGEEGETLQELHPRVGVYPYILTKLSNVEEIDDFAERSRYVQGLRCDGIVLYLTNKKIQQALGRENDKQKFEVAYKFTEEHSYAKVKGIRFSVGLYGNITPVLEIKPITLKGNEISHISLGSVGILEELNLGKGDIVKVSYDIIPVCTFEKRDPNCTRGEKKRFHCPKYCPICGEPLVRKNGLVYCENKKCPSRVMGQVLNHIRVMNMQHIGKALLEQLYREELVTQIIDIYKLPKKKDELLLLENFGKKKYRRLCDEIERVENQPIDEARLCESLSIEGLGYSTFQTIFEEMDLDDLLNYAKKNDISALTKIPGIGKVKAKWICDGLEDKSVRKTLEFLQDKLEVVPVRKDKPKFVVVFSSFQNGDPRKERIIKMVEERGGAVYDKIGPTTDILVVPTIGVGTRKELYAKEHEIKICTPDTFIEMVRV